MATVNGTNGADLLDAQDGVTEFGDQINAFAGADMIFGLGGRDVIRPGAGADDIDGGDGDDIVIYNESPSAIFVSLTGGGVGGDANGDIYVSIESIIGSDFNDFLIGSDVPNELYGAPGNDIVQGKGGDDLLDGDPGDDVLEGGDGDDTLQGDGGVDDLSGDLGNDWLLGDTGDDMLSGGDGDDFFEGGEGADRIDGGAGVDWVDYLLSFEAIAIDLAAGTASGGEAEGDVLTAVEIVRGSNNDDTIAGDANANTLYGLDGSDTLSGGAGADRLIGEDGIDWASYADSDAAVTVDLGLQTASGGHAQGDALSSIEAIIGSAFNDVLIGSDNDDALQGGNGADLLIGSLGVDAMGGDAGIDEVNYVRSDAGVTVDLGAGTGAGGFAQGDTLTGIEHVTASRFADALLGSAANDRLVGRGGDDVLSGGAGWDSLVGGAGADSIDGGGGVDVAEYSSSGAAVRINLGAGTAAGGMAQGDTLAEVEGLLGSDFADSLTGSAGANTLDGGAGADRLAGGDGNDRLIGGKGIDMIIGGAGPDTVILRPAAAGRDLVRSFLSADDTLEISAALFGSGLVAGALDPQQFRANTTGLASDASDRFIFNTSTGDLFFDSNGNASGGNRLIVTFTGTLPVLSAADFEIV